MRSKSLISFKKYHKKIITESLDSGVNFSVTDDSRISSRMAAIFILDDTDYGMLLELSNIPGIYILSLYRVLAKKPRKWPFKRPSHIRPALSTFLKFAEWSTSQMKPYVKGIICKIGGEQTERFIRFANRTLKKDYLKTFKVLPVTKEPDKKIYP